MKYAIIVKSETGNTQKLADAIFQQLTQCEKDCIYTGAPSPAALQADVIYVGFWTDKGTCPSEIAAFLASCADKKIFLFGTAGFGGDSSYFAQILGSVREHMPDSAVEIGSFMCQGRMPASVRTRYENMPGIPDDKRRALLDNFDKALSHPNADDLDALHQACDQIIRFS